MYLPNSESEAVIEEITLRWGQLVMTTVVQLPLNWPLPLTFVLKTVLTKTLQGQREVHK